MAPRCSRRSVPITAFATLMRAGRGVRPLPLLGRARNAWPSFLSSVLAPAPAEREGQAGLHELLGPDACLIGIPARDVRGDAEIQASQIASAASRPTKRRRHRKVRPDHRPAAQRKGFPEALNRVKQTGLGTRRIPARVRREREPWI